MSLADVVDLLACPACAGHGRFDEPMDLDGRSLRCASGHAFDLARQGHVSLLGHAPPAGADTAAMVAARERFLATTAYEPVGALLAAAAVRRTSGPPVVLDVGSGPGWYLDRVLRALAADGRPGRGVALDVSPAAARRAARSLEAVGAVVGDAWARLPVRSGSVDLTLSVFAPRHPAELARVLTPGGTALVVSPLPDHLATLRTAWGLIDVEPGKQERIAATFAEHLEPVGEEDLRYAVGLDRATLDDLVAMGPNAFHRRPPAFAAVPQNEGAEIEVAVRLSVWRRVN